MFFLIYSIATTTYCFAMSVFFSKANIAALFAAILWFVSYQPYSIMWDEYENLSLIEKLIACLFSNSAMSFGIQLILRFEEKGEGLKWSNWNEPVSIDDNLSVYMTMAMMLFDSLIYLIVALYVEQISPGSYGVPEKWNFPFKKSFWFEENNQIESIPMNDIQTHSGEKARNFEAEPTDKRVGVKIVNLRKVYANNNIAVKELTLNMYQDDITVLLGHNGAGKTTTMSLLTGMFPPTSGTAFVNGHNIRTHIHKARSSLGLCTQHNILFDELTVKEHIQFYSRLKGLDKESVDNEVYKYVRVLELEPKIDAMSSTLSGGMKRKLSVALALCGQSKVVLCDEPTSGMDPSARRALWDLLESEKKGRTILLSTHFMDEADVLGDRIAIMAEGDLKCYGTSFFLKKRFGTGYHLVCVKDDSCVTEKITKMLQKYIPNIQIESNTDQELTYSLPNESISMFGKIFDEIEERKENLGLESYGVSETTLEEVFLKVGANSNIIHNLNDQIDGTQNSFDYECIIGDYSDELLGGNVRYVSGTKLGANQFWAMIKKRFLCWKRSWKAFAIQNFIPIFFIVISIIIARSFSKENVTLPSVRMDLSAYGKTTTILEQEEGYM